MVRRRALVALLFVLAAALAVPAAAPAGTIVWSKGGDIWAMNDDGGNQRLLIPKATAGMTNLYAPAVHPAGTTVTFEGSTDANKTSRLGLCGTFPYQYSCTTWHYGFNGTGVYRWTGSGAVERLTAAPAPCWNCSASSVGPEPRADGSVVSAFQHCQGFLDDGSYSCVGAIKNTSGQAYDTCTDLPNGPSPNPASPLDLVYTGCRSDGNNALVVTGPGRAGEHVVGCDDATQDDPSWSPGGDLVIAAEGGTEPGIWIYGAGNTACFSGSLRRAVATPDGVVPGSPRFAGDRIVFDAQGELWSVPASCDGCAFPGAATQLTSGGDNRDPAWTSAALAPRAPFDASGRDVAAPVVTSTQAARQRVLRQRRSIVLKLRSSEAATAVVTGTITVPGRDPKLAKTTKRLAAGTLVTVKVPLSAAALRAVRAGWARGRRPVAVLKLAVRDQAGNTARLTRRITLVR